MELAYFVLGLCLDHIRRDRVDEPPGLEKVTKLRRVGVPTAASAAISFVVQYTVKVTTKNDQIPWRLPLPQTSEQAFSCLLVDRRVYAGDCDDAATHPPTQCHEVAAPLVLP
jgi:hypothetical protein